MRQTQPSGEELTIPSLPQTPSTPAPPPLVFNSAFEKRSYGASLKQVRDFIYLEDCCCFRAELLARYKVNVLFNVHSRLGCGAVYFLPPPEGHYL